MVTRIGNGNLFMAYTHVAHDCVIGNDVVMANAATLGGHVTIDDGAILGGLVGVHQFCRIGSLAMIAGGAVVVMDVPPFTQVQGDRAGLFGLNLIGLKRKGFSPEAVEGLKSAYKIVFRMDLKLDEALKRVRQEVTDCPEVRYMVEFLEGSERGITR
jgi:UDP-N-acetylglucosamine acyltransferase